MDIVQISSTKRTDVGSKSAATARKAGSIPAVIYGKDQPLHVLVTWGDVRHAIYTPDFKLVNVNVEGNDIKCIIKEVQFHNTDESIQHIDFLALTDGVPVKVDIPVRFKGTSIGVKNGGKLIQQIRKLKVKTTPEKLVDELRVDVSHLGLGDVLRVKSVEVTDGVTILANAQSPIANIEIPRALKSAAAADAKAGAKKKK